MTTRNSPALRRVRSSGRRSLTPPARSGFSLVELLVVIGIIALLISLLLPTLAKVREQANQTKCLANLRNFGQAAQLHLNEHSGYLPCAGWEWNPVGGIVNPHGMGDDQATKFDYYLDSGERRPLPVTAAFGHYLGVTVRTDSRQHLESDLMSDSLRRLWRCPSQEAEWSGWSQRASDGWISPDEVSGYAFNEAILGRRDRNAAAVANGDTSSFPMGQITSIRHPTDVCLILDGRTRDPANDRTFLVFDFGPEDTLYDFQTKIQGAPTGKELLDFFRHRRKINVLYVDGHAETDSMDDGGLKQIGVSKGIN